MPPRPRVVFSPKYTIDIGDHVFPTRKFAMVAAALKDEAGLVEPAEPSREDLELAHSPAWVDKVLSGKLCLDDETRLELPFSPELSLAHRLSVSGTILACRHALESGVGLHAGGGSHHAFRDHGEGFCVLNDIACGLLKMKAEGRIARAAVIDLDVHQGNGTAAILKEEESVFTFSMHQGDLYPEKKEKSSLDVEVRSGTRGAEYLKLLGENLERVFDGKPELVIYQAGVDTFEKDVLGGLKLSREDLARRDQLVFEACRARSVPAVVVLGGGYAPFIKDTVDLHLQTLRTFYRLGRP